METSEQEQNKIEAAATLQSASVILSLLMRKPGIHRKVDVNKISVGDADNTYVTVGKNIIKSSEYTAIVSHEGKMRAGLKQWSLASAHLKDGCYRIPAVCITEVTNFVQKMFTERLGLITAFTDAYENLKMDAESDLKHLFDASEYPPIAQIKASFVAEYSWEMHTTPSTLKEINADIFEQERIKQAARLAEDVEKITLGLRLQMLEVTERVQDILSPGTDGKAKKFSPSAVVKLQKFVKLIKDRNLTGDVELDRLATLVGDIVVGLDPKVLKDNAEVKATALGSLTEAVETLRGLTETMPKRKFIFSGED